MNLCDFKAQEILRHMITEPCKAVISGEEREHKMLFLIEVKISISKCSLSFINILLNYRKN